MQTDNFILAFIKREGWKRLLAYLLGFFLLCSFLFNKLDNLLALHYEERFKEKYLDDMLLLDEQLQLTQNALSERSKSEKIELQKSYQKVNQSKQNQSEIAKKVDLYEKKGVVISENSVSDAVGRIDSIRAVLEEQRKQRNARRKAL